MTKSNEKFKRNGVLFEEFKKIPQLAPVNDGRAVFLAPFLTENKNWDMWIPIADQRLIQIKGIPARQFYYGLSQAKDTDIHFRFFQLLVQHLSFPGITYHLSAIEDDIVNLFAVLGQIDLFDELLKDKNSIHDHMVLSSFVTTEFEYFFYVLRSLYNHLQLVIRDLMKLTINLNTGEKLLKRDLKESFAQYVLKNEQLLSVDEIRKSRGIPYKLAEFYGKAGPVFQQIRKFRDGIDHRGKNAPTIFHTENGFAVQKDHELFRSFNIWHSSEVMKNDLVPLSKAMAFFMYQTFSIFEYFDHTIRSLIPVLPSEMAPRYLVYLRTEHNHTFWKYRRMIEDLDLPPANTSEKVICENVT